jgi:hypothetical protein
MGIPTFLSGNPFQRALHEKSSIFSQLQHIKNRWKILPKRLGSVARRFMQSFGTQRSMLAQLP